MKNESNSIFSYTEMVNKIADNYMEQIKTKLFLSAIEMIIDSKIKEVQKEQENDNAT